MSAGQAPDGVAAAEEPVAEAETTAEVAAEVAPVVMVVGQPDEQLVMVIKVVW